MTGKGGGVGKAGLIVLAALCVPASSHAQDKILVAVPPAFDFESEATAKLRKDCALAEHVGRQVLASLKERFPGAEATDDWQKAADRPVVRLWITQLQPAGAPSAVHTDTLNRMGLRAELYEGSERRMFGDWRASSASYSGEPPCPAFDRMAVTLGKNVAGWVPMALRVSAANRAAAEAAAKEAAKDPAQ